MSVVVTANAADALALEAESRRAITQRRARWSALALATLLGLAALPMPVRSEHDDLAAEVETLEQTIAEALDEELALARWGRGEQHTLENLAQLWLGRVDLLAQRNELLTTAAACGLSVRSLDIDEDVDPLREEADNRSATVVLDMSEDEDAAADDTSRMPLRAVRFAMQGRSRLSSLLMFTAMLPHMPHPMRLRTARITRDGSRVAFVAQIDRLVGPLSAAEIEELGRGDE